MAAPPEILRRVEQFKSDPAVYRYGETQVRVDFINPFFEALDWEVVAKPGSRLAYREVVHEERLKTKDGSKAPDYCFYLGDKRKFFVEAKQPSVKLSHDPAPALQVRRYGWTAKLPLSVVTDFEEFVVYDCRIEPVATDKASVGRRLYIPYTEYEARWEEIAALFSKQAVREGALDKFIEERKPDKPATPIDSAFLKEISNWREMLAQNIAERNPKLSQPDVNFAVQMTIDRILFLRICEAKGIESRESLDDLRTVTPIYPRLCALFQDADKRFNSGLFHFTKEKGRDKPDDLSPRLWIGDEVLREILKRLYPPYSPYAFRVIPIEILGQVYEQFLGKVISLDSKHQATVEEKPEVRKAGGVYYTPTYIVDYIVKETVGRVLHGKTPAQASELRILDPACGSGSFLIGAYKYLLDWHLQWYMSDGPDKHRQELDPDPNAGYRLSIAERKRILLNNIYGVDIDAQAVEVTKLSLLLNVLEGETERTLTTRKGAARKRVLPDLEKNIKCGNSLIGYDFYDSPQAASLSQEERDRVNVFDWRGAFPEIMKAGGFDAVIGNPPYVRPHNLDPGAKQYFWQHYATFVKKSDLYCCFVERGVSLLRQKGAFGYIVSNGWLRLDSFENLRQFLLDTTSLWRIIDFTGNVFKDANVTACLLILSKGVNPNEVVKTATTIAGSDLTKLKLKDIPQTAFRESYKSIFDLSLGAAQDAIKHKMRNLGPPLSKMYSLSFGLKTGDDTKFLTYAPDRPEHKPLLRGEDVHRYSSMPKGEYVWYVPSEMIAHRRTARPGTSDRFEQPKVLVRDTGEGLQGTFDNQNYYVKDVLIVSDGSKDVSKLMFLSGILNSKLMRFYYETSFPTLHVQRDELASLPIRTINFSNPTDKAQHDRMVWLVERMLELHKRLAEAHNPRDTELAQREIEATDRQIDRLVYELYGLTEEEIKIVRGETS